MGEKSRRFKHFENFKIDLITQKRTSPGLKINCLKVLTKRLHKLKILKKIRINYIYVLTPKVLYIN